MKINDLSNEKKVLFKNTFLLYVLVFSSYFFSFISVPYQTRILGPDYYGKVAFAFAFMTYFRLVIDFGFILSATEEVAKNRNNKNELSKIVTAVSIIKVLLFLLSLLLVVYLTSVVNRFEQDRSLYLITFLSIAASSFFPDYLYRGLENMKTITIRTVVIKFSFVIMIFIFLNDKEDYYLIPLFTFIGDLLANVAIYIHASKMIGIKIVKVEIGYLWKIFKNSSFFFYSRIASTIYSATNTVILGFIYPVGSSLVGYYSSSDKLINTVKQGFSPIADSLYPYMLKNKDFKLVKRILLIVLPPLMIICVFIGVYANNITSILLGEEFYKAGDVLRILTPIIFMTPLLYMLGFPVLSSMGLSKYANLSVIFGSIVHIILLVMIFLVGELNIYSISVITVISEFVIVFYRIIVIKKNISRMISSHNIIRK